MTAANHGSEMLICLSRAHCNEDLGLLRERPRTTGLTICDHVCQQQEVMRRPMLKSNCRPEVLGARVTFNSGN